MPIYDVMRALSLPHAGPWAPAAERDLKRKAEAEATIGLVRAASVEAQAYLRRRIMLDPPPAPPMLPPHGSAALERRGEDASASALLDFGKQPLHFFAVYDGHGGDMVSKLCASNLHQHLRTALAQHISAGASAVDAMGPALVDAFCATDSGMLEFPLHAHAGSTAVVAVVGQEHIWLAHAGGSCQLHALACMHVHALAASVSCASLKRAVLQASCMHACCDSRHIINWLRHLGPSREHPCKTRCRFLTATRC